MKLFSKLYFAVFLLLMFSACSDSSGNNEVDDSNTDCDCPAGEICDGEGGCLTVCEKDDDCPATFYCDEEKSYCVPTIIEEDGDLDDDSWWEFDIPEGPEFGFESETEHDVVWETDVEHSTTSPWLEFDPKRLDFGAVPLGSSTDKEVTISNLGNAKLEISEIYMWDESAEFGLSFDELPITLLKGEESVISLNFSPQDKEADRNLLVISSNDPATPNAKIEVVTEVKEFPRISFEPDPIDFGLVRLGENEIECRITNSGGLLLKVYRVELDSQSDAVFSVSELPQLVISDDNPMHVPVGESVTFKVVVDAEQENLYSGELILHSNDEDKGVMVVPITASAAEPEIEADPPELDFQNIDIGETVERTCTISNIGAYPLEIETLEFGVVTSDFQMIGELPTLPLILQKDESVDIVVSYSPDENSPDFGSLVIDSNDEDEAHLIVPFINDGSPPALEVIPAELNFGPQQEGTSVIKTLQVKNAGGRLLLLDDYVLETEGTVFYKANVPADMLGGGQMTLVKIGYQPDDLEDDSGSLTIFSNDPEDPELVVPITGGGQSLNILPVAKAGEDGQSVPLATVQLDGSASYDPDGTVEAYFWTILDKPDASHAVPVRPTDAMPFVFFDLAGTYLFELNVTDDEGNVSLGDRVEYTVRPDERIHIQLLWDKDLVDFDLHLVKPEGELWDGLAHGLDYPIQFGDCFFSTCKKEYDPVSGNPVDWSEQGHPSLDIDDQNGYGPENINLNDPTDTNQGDYVVYVHYWDAKYIPDPTTEVTVRIYINGEKSFEAVNTFTEEHQLWNVAAIRWMSNDDAVILDHGLDLEIDEHGQKKK